MKFERVGRGVYGVVIDGVVIGTVEKSVNGSWLGLIGGQVVTHHEPTRQKAAEYMLKKAQQLKPTIDGVKVAKRRETLDKAFWKANKMGDNVIGSRIVESYKTFKDATEAEIEAMGLYIEERLGFGRNLLSKAQIELLRNGGYIN